MPRNGSGSYTLPEAAFQSGQTISSAAVNSDLSDIAAALTQSVSRDGQTTITADQSLSNYKHTNVGNAAARNQYAALGQVQDGSAIWGGTAGGTADALTLTLTPAITAYATGMVIEFIAGASPNTGAATVNVNGVGVKNLRRRDGATALSAGNIPAGAPCTIIYDGTSFRLLQPTVSADLGLGTMATQAANNVNITGGSITGITDLAVADGGTGASTAANARVNLLPSYTGNGGKALALNAGATDAEWISITTATDIQTFIADGTWTKPSGAKFVLIEAWGGGGGGGSGARFAAGTITGGGGAGGGGGYNRVIYKASDLTATVAVDVGAGGTGGAAATVNGANGANGTSGSNTTFGTYLTVYGGGPGLAGNSGAASGGGGGGIGGASTSNVAGAPTGWAGVSAGAGGTNGAGTGSVFSGAGAGSGNSGSAGGAGENGTSSGYAGASGGSGASLTAANAVSNGGTGGTRYGFSLSTPAGGVGSAAAAGGAGGAGSTGQGGGGGGSSTAGAGGAGGAGGGPGGGGGGGGASRNGFNSGAGGNGGDGWVIVYTW